MLVSLLCAATAISLTLVSTLLDWNASFAFLFQLYSTLRKWCRRSWTHYWLQVRESSLCLVRALFILHGLIGWLRSLWGSRWRASSAAPTAFHNLFGAIIRLIDWRSTKEAGWIARSSYRMTAITLISWISPSLCCSRALARQKRQSTFILLHRTPKLSVRWKSRANFRVSTRYSLVGSFARVAAILRHSYNR